MTPPGAMGYEIVFSDIDGTLIDSENRISQGTKRKIQELCRMGIPFILVSARMPSGILPLQRELEITAPIVCYSGALILSERGEPLQSCGMDRERAARIDAFIRQGWGEVSRSAFSYGAWITENIQNEWVKCEWDITSSVPTQGGICGMIPPGGQVHKLLCMGAPELIGTLGPALREEFPGLTVYRSKDTYLEIMDGAVSKSGAVRALCAAYGISTEAAVSFGDNFNDVDMLLATGASFAMGNAPEEVKRQARAVTLDNDHEGVLAGLSQLSFADSIFLRRRKWMGSEL